MKRTEGDHTCFMSSGQRRLRVLKNLRSDGFGCLDMEQTAWHMASRAMKWPEVIWRDGMTLREAVDGAVLGVWVYYVPV